MIQSLTQLSYLVAMALFILSLFAEFIANDKPIFIDVNGKMFFPAVMTYPDTAFAKEPDPMAESPMDYAEHDRTYHFFIGLTKWGTLSVVVILILMAIFLL